MFKTDDNLQDKKLDEMDLDEILTRAEDHDTEGIDAGGTSLGGEQFLNQFAVQDVKADLSWDDIIPQDARAQAEQEAADAAAAEVAKVNFDVNSRKRAAASVPGAYTGMDDSKEKLYVEELTGEKKAGTPTPSTASASASGSKVAAVRKTAAQKAVELKGESRSRFLSTSQRSRTDLLFVVIRTRSPWSGSRIAEVGRYPHEIRLDRE